MLEKGLLTCLPLTLMATPVVLEINEDSKDQSTYSTPLASTESEIILSGTIHVDVTLHPITRKPDRFEFISGNVHYSDATVEYVEEEVFGANRLTITTSGLSGPYLTTNPDATVDPESGVIDNSDHETHLTSGTLRTEIDGFFPPNWLNLFDVTRDYEQEPEAKNFTGTTTITSEFIESGTFTDTYRITLTHHSDPGPEVTDLLGKELTVVSVSQINATGEGRFPSPAFTAWLDDITLPGSDQPDKIRYALGLSPNESFPNWTIQPGSFTLNLPDSGTRAPLEVKISSDLETWTTAGGTIPGGATGPLTIALPGNARFIRLEVPSP